MKNHQSKAPLEGTPRPLMRYEDPLTRPTSLTASFEDPLSLEKSEREVVVSPLIQRVAFYLLGGVIILLCILTLSHSINPPDSALRDADMTVRLGLWDGRWEGKETLLTLNGVTLAKFQSSREYWSTSAMIQTEKCTRTAEDGTKIELVQINKVDPEGGMVARRSQAGGGELPDFTGHFAEGAIFWTCKTPYGYTVRRTWVALNTLHTEEFSFPTGGEEPTVIVGSFTRQ